MDFFGKCCQLHVQLHAGICQVIFLMGVLPGLSIDNLLFSPVVTKTVHYKRIETSGSIAQTRTVTVGSRCTALTGTQILP